MKVMEIAQTIKAKAVEPTGLYIRLNPRSAFQLADALVDAVAMLRRYSVPEIMINQNVFAQFVVEARALLAKLEG
jgi:hypothetical protein